MSENTNYRITDGSWTGVSLASLGNEVSAELLYTLRAQRKSMEVPYAKRRQEL